MPINATLPKFMYWRPLDTSVKECVGRALARIALSGGLGSVKLGYEEVEHPRKEDGTWKNKNSVSVGSPSDSKHIISIDTSQPPNDPSDEKEAFADAKVMLDADVPPNVIQTALIKQGYDSTAVNGAMYFILNEATANRAKWLAEARTRMAPRTSSPEVLRDSINEMALPIIQQIVAVLQRGHEERDALATGAQFAGDVLGLIPEVDRDKYRWLVNDVTELWICNRDTFINAGNV